jgi:hypothetical protein
VNRYSSAGNWRNKDDGSHASYRRADLPTISFFLRPIKAGGEMAHTFIEHIAGKVLQRIVLTNDPDAHEVDIQFQDRTALHIQLDVQMRIELVELRDWKDGNGKLIKKFL